MIKENAERNAIIHSLWENGETINDIAFETGIPRSTVGYYVRKFNKKAKRGDPIILPHIGEEPNSETLAQRAFAKGNANKIIDEMMEKDVDIAYKYLMVIKLRKELQGSLIPTKEESQAGMKSLVDFARSRARNQTNRTYRKNNR